MLGVVPDIYLFDLYLLLDLFPKHRLLKLIVRFDLCLYSVFHPDLVERYHIEYASQVVRLTRGSSHDILEPMKMPVILSYKTLKKDGGLNTAYLKAIESAGGKLKMIETLDEIDNEINKADGILLPGGNDVNPLLYGEERKSHTQPPHNERDRFEMYLLEKAYEKRIPILGICRGLQVINVKFGGTLYQDVEKEMLGAMRHDFHEENSKTLPRSALSHSISIKKVLNLTSYSKEMKLR